MGGPWCGFARSSKNSNGVGSAEFGRGAGGNPGLHRLGLFAKLGESLKTTNCIESLLSQMSQWTRKADRWRNSSQKQRCAAAALLEIELRLRRVKGVSLLAAVKSGVAGSKGGSSFGCRIDNSGDHLKEFQKKRSRLPLTQRAAK